MNNDPITPSDWVTASEAARLLGCSHQRVSQLIDEGSVDSIRPWPYVTLIGRRSIAQRMAGQRQDRISVYEARRYIRDLDADTSDLDLMRDSLREFIAQRRPRWEPQRLDLWALTMAQRLLATGN